MTLRTLGCSYYMWQLHFLVLLYNHVYFILHIFCTWLYYEVIIFNYKVEFKHTPVHLLIRIVNFVNDLSRLEWRTSRWCSCGGAGSIGGIFWGGGVFVVTVRRRAGVGGDKVLRFLWFRRWWRAGGRPRAARLLWTWYYVSNFFISFFFIWKSNWNNWNLCLNSNNKQWRISQKLISKIVLVKILLLW